MKEEVRKEKTEEKRNPALWILVFFLLSIATTVFGILCLYNTEVGFIQNNLALFIALSVVLVCGVCALGIWFTLSKKEALCRTLISVYVFLIFCLILLLILQKTGFFKVIDTAESLQKYLEKSGGWMPVVYILLQYLQVVILPIPSVVSTVAGVALFGPLKATLYSLIGILLGSFTAFFIGRKLGNKAVAWMVGKDTLNKWQNKLKGKDNLLLTIMFVLPLFPDDVLCFIAGLSSMSLRYFLIMVTLSRILTVSVTCYSFDFIPLDTWWGIAIWAVFFIAVIALFIIVYKNMDKIQAFLKRRKEKRMRRKKEEE